MNETFLKISFLFIVFNKNLNNYDLNKSTNKIKKLDANLSPYIDKYSLHFLKSILKISNNSQSNIQNNIPTQFNSPRSIYDNND